MLGKEFRRDDGVLHQIVGVAANSHFGDLHNGPEPIAYMPMKPPLAFTLYVRSSFDAPSVAKMVEAETKAIGLGMTVRDVTRLETLVDGAILKERLLAAIGSAFAVLGLTLAGTGLFGLVNYTVTRLTKEIGIRAALGARRWPLYGLVLKEWTGLVEGGLAIGLAGSLALMHFARPLLFRIQPVDPRVISTSLAIFFIAALIAGALPARRAASIDRVVALSEE